MARKVFIGRVNNNSIIVICLWDVINPDTYEMSIDEYVIVLKHNMLVKKLYSHSRGQKFFEFVKSKTEFLEAPFFYFSNVEALGKEIYKNVHGIINISQNVTKYETQCFYTETDRTLTLYWKQWVPKYLSWSITYENWRFSKLFNYHGNSDFWKDKNANFEPIPLAIQAFDVINEYILVTLNNYYNLYINLLGMLQRCPNKL